MTKSHELFLHDGFNLLPQKALIDLEPEVLVKQLSAFRWYLDRKGRVFTVYGKGGEVQKRFLGSLVLRTTQTNVMHLDGNRLDCTKSNLRLLGAGIYWSERQKRFGLERQHEGSREWGGWFPTLEAAQAARVQLGW